MVYEADFEPVADTDNGHLLGGQSTNSDVQILLSNHRDVGLVYQTKISGPSEAAVTTSMPYFQC